MSDIETKNETPPTAPVWMASQTPKTDTMPPASGEKKARKPRRTKEQMLADAVARPDALRGSAAGLDAADVAVSFDGEGGVSVVKDRFGTRRVEVIGPTMAAEDAAKSAAVDFEKRFGIKPTPRLVDHLPLAVGVLALIVAVFALAR